MKLKLLFTSIIIAFSLLGFSQLPGGLPGGGTPGGGGSEDDDPDDGVPIDNGIFILVAVGAGLGIKKLVKKK